MAQRPNPKRFLKLEIFKTYPGASSATPRHSHAPGLFQDGETWPRAELIKLAARYPLSTQPPILRSNPAAGRE